MTDHDTDDDFYDDFYDDIGGDLFDDDPPDRPNSLRYVELPDDHPQAPALRRARIHEAVEDYLRHLPPELWPTTSRWPSP